jgi:hypothetical protein
MRSYKERAASFRHDHHIPSTESTAYEKDGGESSFFTYLSTFTDDYVPGVAARSSEESASAHHVPSKLVQQFGELLQSPSAKKKASGRIGAEFVRPILECSESKCRQSLSTSSTEEESNELAPPAVLEPTTDGLNLASSIHCVVRVSIAKV